MTTSKNTTMRTYPCRLTAAEMLTILAKGIDALPMVGEDIGLGSEPTSQDIQIYNLWIQKNLMNVKPIELVSVVLPFRIAHLQYLDHYTLEQVILNFLGCKLDEWQKLDIIFNGQVPTVPFAKLCPKIQKAVRAYKGFDNFCMNNPAFQQYFGVERIFAPMRLECSFEVYKAQEGHIVLKLNASTTAASSMSGDNRGSFYMAKQGIVKVNFYRDRKSFVCENESEAEIIGKEFIAAYEAIHYSKEHLIFLDDSVKEDKVFAGESYIEPIYASRQTVRTTLPKADFYGTSVEDYWQIKGFKIVNPIERMAYLKGYKVASEISWIANLPCIIPALERLGIGYECFSSNIWVYAETKDFAETLIQQAAKEAGEIRTAELLQIAADVKAYLFKLSDYEQYKGGLSDIGVYLKDILEQRIDVLVEFSLDGEQLEYRFDAYYTFDGIKNILAGVLWHGLIWHGKKANSESDFDD